MKIKTIKRKIFLIFLPRIVWGAMWILYFTCRNRFHINEDVKRENALFTFWHGELLMMPFLYRKIRDKPNVFVISSEHFDGELMVKIYSYFGLSTIRGSSSKGGIRVLLQANNKLKNGSDVAITPDGPKGPIYNVADGVAIIAQKANANVVVARTICSKYWELKTWDKFKIPKPFATIKYYVMPPFKVNKLLNLETAKNKIKENMMAEPNLIFHV